MALLAAYVSVVQTSLDQKLEDGVSEQVANDNGVGAGVGVATYAGYGEFSLAFEITRETEDGPVTEVDYTGGLLLANDAVAARVNDLLEVGEPFTFDAQFDETENVFHFGAEDLRFSVVPVNQASIQQVLAFYDVTLMNPRVLGGVFLGVLLAFVFCALTMNAVGRAAYQMMNECRRQFGLMKQGFRNDGLSDEQIADPMQWPKKTIVDGKQYPDYAECVAISTAGAQKEMVVPSILAIVVPVVVGIILGVGGVMGLLVGGLTSGFAVAIYMANAGGAWDNAKKYIEKGHHGGKGSEAHKAGVVGDTVGDPFKDTSGPSLNILIKLIAIVSVVFAGLVVNLSPMVIAALGLG